MQRPGVYVREEPLPRAVTPPSLSISAGAFIGSSLMGPTDITLVSSWSQFVSSYGGFSSDPERTTLPEAVYQFFANGGGQCYVCRVLPGDAETARTDLVDESGDAVVGIQAISPGYWGNGVAVDIEWPQDFGQFFSDPTMEGPFSLQFDPRFDRVKDYNTPLLRLNKTQYPVFNVVVYNTVRGSSVVVERFSNLSLDPMDPRYAPRVVSDSSAGSRFIILEDLTSGQGSPPAQVSRQYLTYGSDGQSDITSADLDDAVQAFDGVEGNLVFNVPRVSDVSGVVSHVEKERGDSIVVVDAPNVRTVDEVVQANLPTSGYAAIYWPWISIPDPDPTSPRGSTRWVPPGGSVTGMILRTENSRGVFKAPAGIGASLSGAVATAKRLNNGDLDTLHAIHVNPIRPVPGSGITVMGARTREFNATARYISVRRTLNYIKEQAKRSSQFALFEPNTPVLWEQLRVANGSFLSELWDAGGLAGTVQEQAFYVKADGENNSPQEIANGEVHVEIGVAPVYPSEFVIIRVGQFENDAQFVIREI